MLWSPGLGGRVPVYLQGSGFRVMGDGTRQTLGSCESLLSDFMSWGLRVWKAAYVWELQMGIGQVHWNCISEPCEVSSRSASPLFPGQIGLLWFYDLFSEGLTHSGDCVVSRVLGRNRFLPSTSQALLVSPQHAQRCWV